MRRIATNISQVKKLILIILLLCLTIAIILTVFLQGRLDSEQRNRLCSTPWIVNPMHGKVLKSSSLEPIFNAQILIENISSDQSLCANLAYISRLYLTTDNTGVFNYVSGYVAHPSQKFDITITAPHCNDYHAANLSFGMLSGNKGGLFLIDCDS